LTTELNFINLQLLHRSHQPDQNALPFAFSLSLVSSSHHHILLLSSCSTSAAQGVGNGTTSISSPPSSPSPGSSPRPLQDPVARARHGLGLTTWIHPLVLAKAWDPPSRSSPDSSPQTTSLSLLSWSHLTTIIHATTASSQSMTLFLLPLLSPPSTKYFTVCVSCWRRLKEPIFWVFIPLLNIS
jgi:hypothetical protein